MNVFAIVMPQRKQIRLYLNDLDDSRSEARAEEEDRLEVRGGREISLLTETLTVTT